MHLLALVAPLMEEAVRGLTSGRHTASAREAESFGLRPLRIVRVRCPLCFAGPHRLTAVWGEQYTRYCRSCHNHFESDC